MSAVAEHTAGSAVGESPDPIRDEAVAAARSAAADANGDRVIVGFYCRECAYAAADATGNSRISLPTTIRSVLLPCSGRVGPLHLLTALAEGADGVYVAGCLEDQCHYRVGNFHAIDRVAFVQRLLEAVGVEPERCQMFTMSAADSPKFVAAAKKMHQVISGLPPLERSAHDAVVVGAASAASAATTLTAGEAV